MPLRSQRPAKAYLFPQLGPVEGEEMEPTPTPAPGWPEGAQGPGITVKAARTPPWVTPTPSATPGPSPSATTGGTNDTAQWTESLTSTTPTGGEGTPSPYGPPAPSSSDLYDPSRMPWEPLPEGYQWQWKEFTTPQENVIIGTDKSGQPIYRDAPVLGRWMRLPKEPTKLKEQTVKEIDPDGSQWLRTYSLDESGGITGLARETQTKPATPGKTYPVPTGRWKEYTDAQGNVHTWDEGRGQYAVTGYTEPPVKPPKTYPLPEGQQRTFNDAQGYSWVWDETKGDYNQAGYTAPAPKTYPLPTGQSRSYVDANGYTWTWDETKGDYNQAGWTKPAEISKARIPLPAGKPLSFSDAQGNLYSWNELTGDYSPSGYSEPEWLAADRAQKRKEAEAKMAEEAFTRSQLQPFSAILAAIMQRTGQPVGAPVDYEDFMRAIVSGRAPSQIPQPAGTPTPPWGLLGERVDVLNALRGAGAAIPGASLAWYDVPGIGRVHAGSPEFGQILAQGTKASMAPLPQGVAQQYGPNVYPSEAPFAYQGQTQLNSPATIRQGQSMFASGNPYAAMFAEQDRAKAEQKQREIQGLAQQLGSRRRFWQ